MKKLCFGSELVVLAWYIESQLQLAIMLIMFGIKQSRQNLNGTLDSSFLQMKDHLYSAKLTRESYRISRLTPQKHSWQIRENKHLLRPHYGQVKDATLDPHG